MLGRQASPVQPATNCHRRARPVAPGGPRRGIAHPRRPVVHAAAAPDVTSLTYAALGLGGASFITTFFVLPQLYKKNTDWQTMLSELRDTGVRTVTPKDAYNKSRSAVLLDVRVADRAEEMAPSRSINIPLYIPIQNWDVASIARRIGFAFFGVPGTELNPDFIEQVRAAVPNGREIMVICETGGSIDAKPGNPNGFQSRSLKAVYFLQQAGFQRVSHVSGGLAEWVREGLPLVEAGEDNDDEGSGSETARELVGALSFLGRR